MSTKTGVPWAGIRQPPSTSEQGAQPDAASQGHARPIGRPVAHLKARTQRAEGDRERLALFAVLAFAFALRAGSSLALPNVHWPDEIFETLEPAHRLAFGHGVISWEWRTGIRNWLFPGFLAALMRLSAPLGPGSTGYVVGTTLVLSALGVLPVWAAWRIARRTTGAGPALLAAFACAVWSDLVYFAPKPLNEVVAGHLLAAAVALTPQTAGAAAPRRTGGAGLLFGLVVALRPQFGPAVLAGLLFASRAEAAPCGGAALAGRRRRLRARRHHRRVHLGAPLLLLRSKPARADRPWTLLRVWHGAVLRIPEGLPARVDVQLRRDRGARSPGERGAMRSPR